MNARFDELCWLLRKPRLREMGDGRAMGYGGGSGLESPVDELREVLSCLMELPEFSKCLEPHTEVLQRLFSDLEAAAEKLPKISAAKSKSLAKSTDDLGGEKRSVHESASERARRVHHFANLLR